MWGIGQVFSQDLPINLFTQSQNGNIGLIYGNGSFHEMFDQSSYKDQQTCKPKNIYMAQDMKNSSHF